MYLERVREEDLVFGMLGDFGALARHPAVGNLQRRLNEFADAAGYGKLEVNEKYGGCTHSTLKRFCAWRTSDPNTTLRYSAAAIDVGGPMAAAALLAIPPHQPFSGPELTEMQQAFGEWIEAGRVGCGESAVPGVGTDVLPAPGEPGSGAGGGAPDVATEQVIAPLARRAGMGALGWFLAALALAGGGYALYRYATRPTQVPRPRMHGRRY